MDVVLPLEDRTGLVEVSLPDCSSLEMDAAEDVAGGEPQAESHTSSSPADTERPDSDDEDFFIDCSNKGCSYAGGMPHNYVPTVPVYRCTLCTDGVVVCIYCLSLVWHTASLLHFIGDRASLYSWYVIHAFVYTN